MEPSPQTQDSRPTPHPVAVLLTDEMKARIKAARFEINDADERAWSSIIGADIDGVWCCPMGVALGGGDTHHPDADDVMVALELDADNLRARRTIANFIDYMDLCDTVTPAEVCALLDCEDEVRP